MKVVLFCGGLGLRMRSSIDTAPKPMMAIGDRPVLWHIMRYYAHFGHTEFILCLGYGGASVKQYFMNYDETHSNDFVLSRGGREIELLRSDISEWRISFIETGIDTSIGERLRRVRHLLDGDEVFLANYGDVLTDAPMDRIVDDFVASDATASLLAVPPQASFHTVAVAEDGRVDRISSAADLPLWLNGGYFVLRQGVFDVLGEGEDLVGDAFVRLAERRRLAAVRYTGFWAPMDTLKERSLLEDLDRSGHAPWKLWCDNGSPVADRTAVALPLETMHGEMLTVTR
ncbi:glucose-1-phosphate cytidylyltransferase [Kineosporia sp. R_H_3]|uniref:glucose-1-phosphate cytidylyltransferase n=1 Tax=Kineosporia sp. R_H_3 TaxID=1961848 RepID=UPI0018EA1636|nr:glucose-1-phosphate cytidylyltransferase [Kineosporia sp. R_H_3]